jgi:4'-phosphopantetheinyl transferase
MKSATTTIWAAQVPEGPTVPRAFLETLDEEEQDHCRHLAREASRLRFMTGRVLLRRMLSRIFLRPPEQWHFRADDWGKPRLLDSYGLSELDFSVSHSGSVVVAAISSGCRCGIDVEELDVKTLAHPMDTVFNFLELEWVNRLPSSDWKKVIRLWTAKEAYAKLVGLGFFLDFSSFAISLEPLELLLSERGINHPKGVSLMGFEFELADRSYAATLAVREGALAQQTDVKVVNLTESNPVLSSGLGELPEVTVQGFEKPKPDSLSRNDRFHPGL